MSMEAKRLRPLVACPLRAWAAGLRRLPEFAVLVHVGRCGLQGATRVSTAAALRVDHRTVSTSFRALERDGWIRRVGQSNGRGRTVFFLVTAAGWKLLTEETMEVDLYPGALTLLKIP